MKKSDLSLSPTHLYFFNPAKNEGKLSDKFKTKKNQINVPNCLSAVSGGHWIRIVARIEYPRTNVLCRNQ
jgi:hypothetical protein